MITTNFDIHFGNATDVGFTRRSNEDYYGSFKVTLGWVFVLCDGMGGHVGGAVAAQTCVEAIRTYFDGNGLPASSDGLLAKAVKFANSVVYKRATGDRSLTGMGTTIVLLLVDTGGLVYYAHVGDSRIYLFHKGFLQQLTKDHSYVQKLVDDGIISVEQAESHPGRNRILRAVGTANDVEVEMSPAPFRLSPPDTILMCSDGLSGMVKKEKIVEILSAQRDPQAKADLLIEAALQAGGLDNVTVQVIGGAITERPFASPPGSSRG